MLYEASFQADHDLFCAIDIIELDHERGATTDVPVGDDELDFMAIRTSGRWGGSHRGRWSCRTHGSARWSRRIRQRA